MQNPLETPNRQQVQKLLEERLAAVDEVTRETVSVEWRGTSLPVTVVAVPVDLLYYNPETHRIRAQRSLNSGEDENLRVDPYGGQAQSYLHQLLMGDPSEPNKTDPEFVALKSDIREHGMRDPGITTRGGILVNGNTRRAALKELHVEHMRVGVLPADASWRDVELVELSLQLRKDYRRDYSYVNLLLAIDEQIRIGRAQEEVMKDFRISAKTLQKHLWILELINQAITRSKTEVGDNESSLRFVDFENHQGKLEELYRSYSALKQSDPNKAELLKEGRLTALVLGGSKTDLRWVEADFVDTYLVRHLPAGFVPSSDAGAAKRIPGLDITVQPESEALAAAQALSDKLLKARAASLTADLADPANEAASEAAKELGVARDAIQRALDQAGKAARLVKRRLGPADRLSDATEALDLCYEAVAEARATNAFDAVEFDESILNLQNSLEKLAKLLGRDHDIGEQTTAGLKWLLSILPERHHADTEA
jgi:hypothetical protein